MTAALPAIQAVVDHLRLTSATRSARCRTAGWAATQPLLAPYPNPAAIAEAIASAGLCRQGQLIVAVLAEAAEDGLAQLTVIAGRARRLQWIVGRWRRARVLAANLVAECGSLWPTSPPAERGRRTPAGRGLHLVQCAWQAVRGPRRRQLRMPPGRLPWTGTWLPTRRPGPRSAPGTRGGSRVAGRAGQRARGPAGVLHLGGRLQLDLN